MILHYIYDPFMRLVLRRQTAGASGPSSVAGDCPRRRHDDAAPTARRVSPQLRNYVMPHDRRIAEYTGQPFGEAYFEGLLRDDSAVFDSAPPIAAVLAAEADRGLADCRCSGVCRPRITWKVGASPMKPCCLNWPSRRYGLEPEASMPHSKMLIPIAHIKASRGFLAQLRGQGFPTFALEQDGQFTLGRHQPLARQAASLCGTGLSQVSCLEQTGESLRYVASTAVTDTRWIHWLLSIPSKDSAQNFVS